MVSSRVTVCLDWDGSVRNVMSLKRSYRDISIRICVCRCWNHAEFLSDCIHLLKSLLGVFLAPCDETILMHLFNLMPSKLKISLIIKF